MKKGDKPPSQHTDEPEIRYITFDELKSAIGNPMCMSQQANWEIKRESEKSKDKLDKVEAH